jgi:hypothetical protein
LWFYQYNPHTQDFAMSTQYPISIGDFSDYSYQMTRATGDWLVMGVGANPWILAAYNFATGEWKTLKEVTGLGSYKTFQLHKLEDGTIIVVSEEIAGDPSSVTYWLFLTMGILPPLYPRNPSTTPSIIDMQCRELSPGREI